MKDEPPTGPTDVLTANERRIVEGLRAYLKSAGITTGSGPTEMALIDRLVAEVERLRTANQELRTWRAEAESQYGYGTLAAEVLRVAKERDTLRARDQLLELVAKAAEAAIKYEPAHSRLCAVSVDKAAGCDCLIGPLRAALAALNPPVSEGGAPCATGK